jgi:hypothetical protein
VYAGFAMHDGIWDLGSVDMVYGSNVADLSPNVTQVHDIRWAYAQGSPNSNGDTFWNSGFIGYEFADKCIFANWLAIHLGKTDLDAKFEQLASYEKESQERKSIEFNQPSPPAGISIFWSWWLQRHAQVGLPMKPSAFTCIVAWVKPKDSKVKKQRGCIKKNLIHSDSLSARVN